MTFTEKLIERLRLNFFKEESTNYFRRIRPSSSDEISYTFAGNGWVKKTVICHPSNEGWSTEKLRCKQALEHCLWG